MNELEIITSLNKISSEIKNEKLKNELRDISIRLAGRFTRINPNFRYLEEAYNRDRFNKTPLENTERNFSIPGFSDFSIAFSSGLSEEYQLGVLRSIFNKFEINEDLPKGFLDFILRDKRFGNAVLKFVKDNNLQEIFAKMFEVYEDYVSVLLDKIARSKDHSFEIREKIIYLKNVLKEFLTPNLKNKLDAMMEIILDQTDSQTDLFDRFQMFRSIDSPKLQKSEQQRAEQELKQALSNNKKQILTSLKNIANELDKNGLYKQANTITNVMNKVAQTINPEVEEFQKRHPAIKREIEILKTSKPIDGAINIQRIYARNPYWNMPTLITENQIGQRINDLNNPIYLKELAAQRLKFLQRKLLQNELSINDRTQLQDDAKFLKKFIGISNLQDNPELNRKLTPNTEFQQRQMQNDRRLEEITPKSVDYNQLVSDIAIKILMEAMPKKSKEDLNMMLVGNLTGYKVIFDNPNLRRKLYLEAEKLANKFLDKENALQKINDIIAHKLARFYK